MDAHNDNTPVRGRFAPSPSGPLHFGSLVAAVGSFLSARAQNGAWLLRIDDVDPPRCVAGAADDILRSLERHGLEWDGPVLYQGQRFDAYASALEQLTRDGHSYPCGCSRKEIGAISPALIYPGTCRNGLPDGRQARAIRVRCDNEPLCIDDRLQGYQCRRLRQEIGDFVVKRADGFYAYHLATALDDAFQQITEVVRGADLLDASFPQWHLQDLLALPHPTYLHLPVAVTAEGNKLSKQTRAPAIDDFDASDTLTRAFAFLGHPAPAELHGAPPKALLAWAITHWQPSQLPHCRRIAVDENDTPTHRDNRTGTSA